MATLEEPMKEIVEVKNYIDAEWIGSKGEIQDVVNPVNGEVIGRVPTAAKEQIDAAVKAAKAAFPDWRRTPPVARARIFFRLREFLEASCEEVSRVQTQEHGKMIDGSRGETRRGIENVQVACGIPALLQGYNSEDIASGIDEYLVPTPLGFFGIIGPFSFPFMIPLWSAPYAVATGNTIVISPQARFPRAR
jgi:malonate-semialdehyde dehydrogenase (acetylating)/methylmalonate-semialdehyde dehydrogenase